MTMLTTYQKCAINGLLLSDGHLKRIKKNSLGNSRLEFTFKSEVLDFIIWLKFDVLGNLCTNYPSTPYPKESPTQYWFGSKQLPIFTEYESLWYEYNNLGVTLAFWIMGDGYWK
ncbi:hypothetical protein AYI69_g11588 [Smittium culicis]|uniref:Homing endonuclease LAGLIDADG domain-containing protein n=1 Tax=Smittium culicis TaxID=133412 RepID=A0A1R1WXD2_9FUNG|nr:hypothetical protein AYI69_g11588 [Smittium culicis]